MMVNRVEPEAISNQRGELRGNTAEGGVKERGREDGSRERGERERGS